MTLGARPRNLPIAPTALPAKKRLPLAADSRDVDKRARPIYAVWEITLACDLACRHCGSRAGRSRPDELTTKEALDMVHQMHALGVLEVTVIGGEAYLRDDWTQIVKEIRKLGMQCSMTTGGRGLTRERVREAKDAGLQSVSVSIDGFRESHDALRGVKGSFDAAMNAMDYLNEAKIPVACNTQINRLNHKEIPGLFDLLCTKKIHGWQFQLTTAMGRGGDEPDTLLEPWRLIEVMPMLAKLKKKADEHEVRFWPGNNIGYFGPYEHVIRAGFPGGYRGSCGAGRSTLGIEANGDIKGCPSLPTKDYVGGNIREYPLQDVWEKSAPLRFTRDFVVDDLYGFCRTCYYAEDCRGGCNWTAHVLLGKKGDNPYCHHRVLELLEKGERESLKKVEEAEGLPFDYGRYEIVREPWPADQIEWARALAKEIVE